MKSKRILSLVTAFAMTTVIAFQTTVSVSAITASPQMPEPITFERVTSNSQLEEGARYMFVGETYGSLYAMPGSPRSYYHRLAVNANGENQITVDPNVSYGYDKDYVYTGAFTLGKIGDRYTFKIYNGDALCGFPNDNYYGEQFVSYYGYSQTVPVPINFNTSGSKLWDVTIQPNNGQALIKTYTNYGFNTETPVWGDKQWGYISFSIPPKLSEEHFYTKPLTSAYFDETYNECNTMVYLYKEICNHHVENELTHISATAPSCSHNGNTEYYYCSYCNEYFATDKTTRIKLSDTVIAPTAHNYADGVCSVCHSVSETSKFTQITTYDELISGEQYIFVGKSGDKYYAMGTTQGLSGRNAVEVIPLANGKIQASSDSVEFITTEDAVYTDNNYSGPKKLKASGGYIVTADEQLLTAGENVSLDASSVLFDALIPAADRRLGTYSIGTGTSLNFKSTYGDCISFKPTATPTFGGTTELAPENEILIYKEDCKHGGTLEHFPAIAPTCVSDGNSEYWHCTKCDKYFSDAACETEIEKDSYNLSNNPNNHAHGLSHTPAVAPTCAYGGNLEYYKCPDCGVYFSDADGLTEINYFSLKLAPLVAKDDDNNGFCDICGKAMPFYKKITSADEIVNGSKYLMVSKIDGKYYALSAQHMTDDKSGKGEIALDSGTMLSAVEVPTLDDNRIGFNDAKNSLAMMMQIRFAAECTSFDEMGLRYGLYPLFNGMECCLQDQFGSFFIFPNEDAKYGYLFAANANSTLKIKSIYSSNWDPNGENGLFRMYDQALNGGSTTQFFSILQKSDLVKDTDTLTEYPVYLYRLTETGTVGNISYTANDSKSTVDYTVAETANTELSTDAAQVSGVYGTTQALTQTALNGFVTGTVGQTAVNIEADVNITVANYTPSDGKTEIGASITFNVTPTATITDEATGEAGTPVTISNDSFNGSPMVVTLYTGGVYPQQIVHIKHDGTKEYFYPEYSDEVMSGGEKSFAMSYDSSGNTYVTFSITEFSDIMLLETPEVTAYKISDYDSKSGTFNISCIASGTYSVIFATYNGTKLTGTRILTQPFNAGVNTIPIPSDISLLKNDKIFLWESLETIKPLCECYTVKEG